MTTRPLLASTAAATALLLGAAAGSPALASTAAAPAKGAAGSALSLLQVTAGGHQLALGGLTMTSDTVSGIPLASITLSPVTADGTTYGQQVITPSNSPLTVPAATTPSALVSFASLTSPSFVTTATTAPATHVGSTSLGSLSLLGIAVPLTGSVDVGSSVSATEGALASKSVTLKNLSLPSISAILGALGLDLGALPVGTLPSLVEQLGIATTAVNTAQAAVDTAQAQVDAATTAASDAVTALATATGVQTTAQTALTDATTALQALLDQVVGAILVAFPGANTILGYAALSQTDKDALEVLLPGTAAAFTAYTAAQTALAAADAAVAAAQAVVDTAQAALTALVATLSGLVATLESLASAVLDGTPLVSLDSLSVSSRALVITAKAGGQYAQVLGGTITGLKVLGTDVLQSALGSSSLDVVDLVGTAADDVTSTINGLTGTLSSVLSSVPGLPTLSIPAPQVKLLTRSTSTSISGGYGHALSSVQGLQITLPSITLPSSVALPGAASLPAFAGITQTGTDLTSGPVSLGALTLSDNAAFRPAVLASAPTTPITPTTPGAGLAPTGLPVGVAVLSLVLLGGALVLRRRRSTDS